MRDLNEIFTDKHDANIARHYLTVMGSEAAPEIVRDFTGEFHRIGTEGTIVLKNDESAVLRRLERCQVIESANKPVRYNAALVGYRMALVNA